MKAIHLFLNIDMRLGHDGLLLAAKKKGVDIRAIGDGEAVIFVNAAKNRMKSYSYNGVICYLRLEGNRTIDLNAMDYIPKAFDSDGKLDYSKALRTRLEKLLGVKPEVEKEKVEVVKKPRLVAKAA